LFFLHRYILHNCTNNHLEIRKLCVHVVVEITFRFGVFAAVTEKCTIFGTVFHGVRQNSPMLVYWYQTLHCNMPSNIVLVHCKILREAGYAYLKALDRCYVCHLHQVLHCFMQQVYQVLICFVPEKELLNVCLKEWSYLGFFISLDQHFGNQYHYPTPRIP
jgi:hypothetical protein